MTLILSTIHVAIPLSHIHMKELADPLSWL